MRTRLLLALVLLFPTLAPAQTIAPSEFDRLRQQRPEIRTYFESLVTRNLANQVANAMSTKGFSDEEIRKVVNGRPLAAFSRRVIADPKVNQALERFLDRVLAPGALETMVQKKNTEMASQRQAAMAQAVDELVRHQMRLRTEELEKPTVTLWQRLWDYLKRDLF